MNDFLTQDELVCFIEKEVLEGEKRNEIAKVICRMEQWEHYDLQKYDILECRGMIGELAILAEKYVKDNRYSIVSQSGGRFALDCSMIDAANSLVNIIDRSSLRFEFDKDVENCENWKGDLEILAREWLDGMYKYEESASWFDLNE